MNEKCKKVLDDIVEKILSDEADMTLPAMLKRKIFFPPDSIPCFQWSRNNQFHVFLGGTADARGFKQWKEAGRYVKKGSKALYILIPMKRKNDKGEEQEEEEKKAREEREKKLQEEGKEVIEFPDIYFSPRPVFRYEDTAGDELDYMKEFTKGFVIPDLPLYDVAVTLGVSVQAVPLRGSSLGTYYIREKKITLSNDSERTFLHELSHAVDFHLRKEAGIINYDYDLGEVVAELSSCLLASIYGKTSDLRMTKDYIKRYSEDKNKQRTRALMVGKSLERVEAIYRYIESVKEPEQAQAV